MIGQKQIGMFVWGIYSGVIFCWNYILNIHCRLPLCRCGLIQRPEQLKFSYMAILDGAHALLSSLPSNDDEPASDSENFVQSEDDATIDDSLSDTSDVADGEKSSPEYNANKVGGCSVYGYRELLAHLP